MVRTRSTDPCRNIQPEIGGPSTNPQVTVLEVRIVQMSKDMEALTEQNARLLQQILKGSNINAGGEEEHGSRINNQNDVESNIENGGNPRDNQNREGIR